MPSAIMVNTGFEAFNCDLGEASIGDLACLIALNLSSDEKIHQKKNLSAKLLHCPDVRTFERPNNCARFVILMDLFTR